MGGGSCDGGHTDPFPRYLRILLLAGAKTYAVSQSFDSSQAISLGWGRASSAQLRPGSGTGAQILWRRNLAEAERHDCDARVAAHGGGGQHQGPARDHGGMGWPECACLERGQESSFVACVTGRRPRKSSWAL